MTPFSFRNGVSALVIQRWYMRNIEKSLISTRCDILIIVSVPENAIKVLSNK